ncbi:hypothetical protein GDO81_024544 [Engystomops pustulosus]|uniref:Uncharacterized protein n=1 Tax=Engystomops pustulosus TaxID=76066 RepID=A0AAV6YTT3_ENGPU|nr:hypothetical protein GDO81_024544 [Engystomops pustulosus]
MMGVVVQGEIMGVVVQGERIEEHGAADSEQGHGAAPVVSEGAETRAELLLLCLCLQLHVCDYMRRSSYCRVSSPHERPGGGDGRGEAGAGRLHGLLPGDGADTGRR